MTLNEAYDSIIVADAYELAAEWHDKQAGHCRDVAADEPRIGADIRAKAKDAARHHAGSAAALRLAALDARRKALAD